MGYLVAILATLIGSTILRSYDIVQRSPDCRRGKISPDFRPYPRTTGENFHDKLDGNVLEAFLPLPRFSRYSPPPPQPTATLFPSENRKRDFLISRKVYSCTFFFLEPFQISRYRYGGAKVGWKYGEGGRISHGFREWPPEAFNQLANSTVLYPSKPLTKNLSEGRKSREGWEKSRYSSRGGFCVDVPAALLHYISPRTYVAPASCFYLPFCLFSRVSRQLTKFRIILMMIRWYYYIGYSRKIRFLLRRVIVF